MKPTIQKFAFVLLFANLALAFTEHAQADVKLPGIFGDHMVLQRDQPIRVWGWADPGEEITVKFGEHVESTTASQDGSWRLELPACSASSESATLEIRGKNLIEFNDVLVGEVWLCSGQSNMEWSVSRSANPQDEIADGNHPLIRHIKIQRRPSAIPQPDIEPGSAEWEICSPETVGDFTAVGYYAARTLMKELGVPVGLVNSTWGGTRIEPWTCLEGFSQVPELAELYQQTLRRSPGSPQHEQGMAQFIDQTSGWLSTAREQLDRSQLIMPAPRFPDTLLPLESRQDATSLFNGMIQPVVGFSMRGVFWYQGEANHREGMQYFYKKQALVNGWRKIWEQGDFPFYVVQIAPFQYGNENPEILAEFWEAQQATLQIPKTGVVITNDITNLRDIHPKNKQDVGKRLALLALKNEYGKSDIVAESPVMERLEIETGKVLVTFSGTGGELKTRDGKSPNYFELTGIGSGGFHPAEATISGNTVSLQSDKVQNPTAFRFAWNKLAEPNLTGATGLPVGAVRGGRVPSLLESVKGGTDYQLVYDLDLNRLGNRIRYDVDNHEGVQEFDRIGYLLELESDEKGKQQVFVSMRAFTNDASKIGIPVASNHTSFQQTVSEMDVYSNVQGLSGEQIETGNIEFWPNNYNEANSGLVNGASDRAYDFGDQPYGEEDGYGSMQIHNFGSGKTIFAINHWREGRNADIGIGNGSGNRKDWTFSRNARTYKQKRLRVYVRPKK